MVVPPSAVAFSIGPEGVAVGKHWQSGGATLQVAGDVSIEGKLHLSDPNVIVIDGTAYQRQGVINGPWATEFSGSSPVYYRILDLGSLPYTPPAGWYFHWSTGRSSVYSLISNFNAANAQKPLHVQFVNNGTTALTARVWELRPI